MSLVDQGFDLSTDLGTAERAADGVRVRTAEAAILAIVDAQVADVERGKQYNAVAVDGLLELPGGGEDLFDELRVVGVDQHGRFCGAERLFGEAFGDDVAHLVRIGGAIEEAVQVGIVDEVDGVSAQAGC